MAVNAATSEKNARQRLLGAAEKLFLARGYEGVSTRDITDSAGTNVASVSYYFQGKESLYREVIRQRLRAASKDIIQRLEALASGPGTPDLELVVSTYVSAFLGQYLTSREAQRFLRLVSDEVSEQGIATDIILDEVVKPIHGIIKDAIRRARPDISEEKAALCVSSIAGQMFHFVRSRHIIKDLTGREYGKEFVGEIVRHITEFSLKGIG